MSYAAQRVHTDPRLRRRRKAVERSRRRKAFVRASVLLALAAVVWAVLWSPLLDVRNLELRGVEHTSAEEVLEAAALGSGTNILRLSTDVVQERIEGLPWVKEASVARVLPGTLRIKIEERKAAMALSLGAAHWIVDKSGRVLEAGKAENLPVLAGANVDGIKVGMDIEAEQVVGGLRVYRSLSPGVRKKVAAIFAPTPDRITLALTDGSQVRYGSAEMLAAKSSVLRSLLARLERDGVDASYIDLRVPTSPAVAPVVATPPDVPVVTEDGEIEAAATTDPGTEAVVDPNAEVAPTDSSAETVVPDGAGAEATTAD